MKPSGISTDWDTLLLYTVFGALCLWIVASWLTHVIVCIKAASWGLLIAGAVFFPVGVIHGTGIWFNLF